jgi:hypothetical protein
MPTTPYNLDLKKDIDYDEKITQRAAIMDEDSMNNYFYDVVYYCLDWEQKEHVTNFKIYEHTLNWASHNIFRRGYLFSGHTREPAYRPAAGGLLYLLHPAVQQRDLHRREKGGRSVLHFQAKKEEFKNTLKLYSAALIMKDLAEEKNKAPIITRRKCSRRSC